MGIIAKKKKDKKSFQTVLKEFPSEVKKNWKIKTAILMIAPIALLIDQITKSLVVRFIPLYGSLWGDPYEGILRIIHVRNTAIAFGLGPLYQRIAFALIIGGGFGNLADRIFRPGNVVDFVDTIWFGIDALRDIPLLKLLSFERWPTWNFADACVVVAVVILLVGMISEEIQTRKRKKKKQSA